MKTEAVLLAGLLSFSASTIAMTVELVPTGVDPNAIPLGGSFTVEVRGSFPGGLDGGGYHILYNPDIVDLTGFSVDPVFEFSTGTVGFPISDPVIPDPSDPTLAKDAQGRVQLDAIVFNTFAPVPPAGDFIIGTLNFLATGLGTTTLGLEEFDLNPFAEGGSLVAGLVLNGVQVTVVPIPAALSLFLGSLGGLLVLRRRRPSVRWEPPAM